MILSIPIPPSDARKLIESLRALADREWPYYSTAERIERAEGNVSLKAAQKTAVVLAIAELKPPPEKDSPLDRLRDDLIRGGAMTGVD